MTELSKIVAQRLPTATYTVHLDPDVITAFVEKTLGERERDQVLGHLAQCRDCREIVALSLPRHETALPTASVRPLWLGWPVLRWGALAACVVVVGAAVTLHREFRASSRSGLSAERSDSSKMVQETAQTTSGSEISVLQANPAQAPEARTGLAIAGKKVELAKEESPKGSVAAAKTGKPSAFVPLMKAPSPPIPAQTEAAEVGSAPVPVTPSSNAMDEVVPGRSKDAFQLSSSDGSDAAGGAMAGRPAVAMAQSALGGKKALAAPIGLAPRWTLSADGTLQRSFDSGRTWETIPVAGQSNFRALAADGLEIWVGGTKGALYHSSDAGQNWTQVQPAANGEVLTDDIIGVEFTDRLHGTVTTSGQQKWITADAGQSWQKQ